MGEIRRWVYNLWRRKKSQPSIYVALNDLSDFAYELENICTIGLKRSKDKFDRGRYEKAKVVLIEMQKKIESYATEKNITIKKPTKTKTVEESQDNQSKSHFLADKSLGSAINKLKKEAENKLWICFPWIDESQEFITQLDMLKEEGVDIILITHPAKKDSKHHQALKKLQESFSQIETNKNLHTKMIIADDKKMYVGSANMFECSLSINQEAGIITENQYLVNPTLIYFRKIYGEARNQRITK